MNKPIDFSDCWSKIKGAERQIDLLQRLTSPLDRSFYELAMKQTHGPAIYLNPPTQYQLAYRPKENIPDALANIIGACFAQLRSALDYAARRIVLGRVQNADPKKSFHFPTAPRKDLPAHKGIAPIEQAIPGFNKLLLKDIRPENGPNEHLWWFATVSNEDKHADFIPTITMAGIKGKNLRLDGMTVGEIEVRNNAARPCILVQSNSQFTIDNDLQVAVEVTFGEGTPVENQSVVPTLYQVRDVVSEALKAVERLTNNL